LERSLRIVNQL